VIRATLKSLLSRKLRLILSGLAVVLGVMFVSGAFVLTDTLGRSFDQLFKGVYANTDVQVAAKSKLAAGQFDDSERVTSTIPASEVDTIGNIDGVAKATGIAFADGARLIGSNGKVVTTGGAPRFRRSPGMWCCVRAGGPAATTRSRSTRASPSPAT
jgi:putative ABC transport system permease protein